MELLIGLEVGRDVYLYVIAFDAGKIYRIAPPGHLGEDISRYLDEVTKKGCVTN